MRNKQFVLFLIALIILSLFMLLPSSRQWAGKVLSYAKDFGWQRHHLDRETRMRKRLGNSYIFTKQIAGQFERKGIKEQVLVLLPPTSYFTQRGVKYHVPEPAVFYYYTGLKTVWANSSQAIQAGWYVRVNEGKIIVDSVTDRQQLQDSINVFKKMGITL